VVASRANYGRIKSVLAAIKDSNKLELQLVVSASALLNKYGEVYKIIEKDGFIITRKAYYILEGENHIAMAKSTGMGVIELASIFDDIKPDMVLTVADRYETLATAIASTYMNIPLIHTQGGEVTGSIDESVRHAITKLAHLHFPATEQSRNRLIKMGEDPNIIFNVGCPAMDYLPNLDDIRILNNINLKGVGNKVNLNKEYILVVQHPVTTEYSKEVENIKVLINSIDKIDNQVIWLWPNVDAGSDIISKEIRTCRESGRLKNVFFAKNFEIEEYASIMKNASVVVGNSSSFIREGSFLGTPAIIVGNRQKNRERGHNVIEVGFIENEIISTLRSQITHGKYKAQNIFGDGSAGRKIVQIIENINFQLQKEMTY
jgi:UDP-hydrolysing UDP-N-acetyl-D-glucosamine 2-epimerase